MDWTLALEALNRARTQLRDLDEEAVTDGDHDSAMFFDKVRTPWRVSRDTRCRTEETSLDHKKISSREHLSYASAQDESSGGSGISSAGV